MVRVKDANWDVTIGCSVTETIDRFVSPRVSELLMFSHRFSLVRDGSALVDEQDFKLRNTVGAGALFFDRLTQIL